MQFNDTYHRVTVLVGVSELFRIWTLHFPNLYGEVCHKDKIKKEYTPHLCFLEPISSLLVKTWTLVEIKNSKQGILASSVAHLYKSYFLLSIWRVCTAGVREHRKENKRQGITGSHGSLDSDSKSFLFTRKQSWKAALTADPKLSGKHVESWSSFSSWDQIFQGLIISSDAGSFHPCQVPSTAPTPTGCSCSQESSCTRKAQFG